MQQLALQGNQVERECEPSAQNGFLSIVFGFFSSRSLCSCSVALSLTRSSVQVVSLPSFARLFVRVGKDSLVR